ncbi:MAG TPA: hypothetical protein VK428_12935 [Acidimicrobiales bacterium]|nr:hypothetical protein [Acidimicrobiales bacterium]
MPAEVPPGEQVVDADVLETGVNGLVLTRAAGGQWRLVHKGTGLMVSRSAVSEDRRALLRLAQQLAPLADWSGSELSLPGPLLRQAVEEAATRSGLILAAAVHPSSVHPDGAPTTTMPIGSAPSGPSSSEDDLELLRRVLRLVHAAVAPGVFASAIAELDGPERARLRELLLEGTAHGVVKPLSTTKAPAAGRAPRRPASGTAPGPASSSGTAAG